MSAKTIAAVLIYLASPKSQPVVIADYPEWKDCQETIDAIEYDDLQQSIRLKLYCIRGHDFSMMERRSAALAEKLNLSAKECEVYCAAKAEPDLAEHEKRKVRYCVMGKLCP